MGLLDAIDRAAAKPHDNGRFKTVCTTSWKENQASKQASKQFISTAAVYVIYVEI